MMESERAASRDETLYRRTFDSLCRSIALVLDGIERRQNARDTALCLEVCPKAACRRAGRCREEARARH